MWDYANLSIEAKNAGGPAKLIKNVSDASVDLGRAQGRLQMIPVVLVGMAITYIATTEITKAIKEKKNKLKNAQESAINELVNDANYSSENSQEE